MTAALYLLCAAVLLTGVGLAAGRAARGRQRLRVAIVAALAAAVGASLFLPLSVVTHRLIPTPMRAVLWIGTAIAAIPFFVAVNWLAGRGEPKKAAAFALIAHAGLVAAVVIAVFMGVMPDYLLLLVPLVICVFALVELFASFAYSASKNAYLIGLVEGLWIAGVVAVTLPL